MSSRAAAPAKRLADEIGDLRGAAAEFLRDGACARVGQRVVVEGLGRHGLGRELLERRRERRRPVPLRGELDPPLVARGPERLGQAARHHLLDHAGEERPLGVDLEGRVQSRFERPRREQPAAEGVDRRDLEPVLHGEQRRGALAPAVVRPGEVGERQSDRVHAAVHAGEHPRDPLRHLGRRAVGEGDRDDALGRAARDAVRGVRAGGGADRRRRPIPARPEQPGDDPRRDDRRLAGAGPGVEQQRALEFGARDAAGALVVRAGRGQFGGRHGASSVPSRITASSAANRGSDGAPEAPPALERSSAPRTAARQRNRIPLSSTRHAERTSQ